MKKLLYFLPLLTLLWLSTGLTAQAYSLDADITQEIVPLDCVFQIVNDGSGTVIYLTPNECGHPLPPDPETPPTPTPQPTIITVVDTGRGIVQIPFVPVAGSQPSRLSQVLGSTPYLQFSPLASVESREEVSTEENNTSWSNYAPPAPIIAVGLLTILLVVLVVLL